MIHLVNSSHRHLYGRELDEFHRERHRQFVIERGWPLRSVDGGEYDDYDDDKALYLVGLSLDGDIGWDAESGQPPRAACYRMSFLI